VPTGKLNFGTTYTWKVRYEDNYSDWSSYSTPTSFATMLPGDYNNNGLVDAADYGLWRANQGTNHALPNDPIGGTIGPAQFDQWRAHFGKTAGSGSGVGANVSVPEPATLVMLLTGMLALCSFRCAKVS
jgi:hypothetical protein